MVWFVVVVLGGLGWVWVVGAGGGGAGPAPPRQGERERERLTHGRPPLRNGLVTIVSFDISATVQSRGPRLPGTYLLRTNTLVKCT